MLSTKKIKKSLPVTLFAMSALALAQLAHAKPLRFDNGSFAFPTADTFTDPIWNPQGDLVPSFGTQLDLGFNFGFIGGTATKIQVNTTGLELLDATGASLGSITPFGLPGDDARYGVAVSATTDPLPPLDGVAITDAIRVLWDRDDSLTQTQVVLFNLANGDSLIEFNYALAQSLDLTTAGIDVGLISPLSGTGFNLVDALAGSPCLAAFGAESLENQDCTAYFAGSPLAAVATGLPPLFQTVNGGTLAGGDELADFRFLVRLTGSGSEPPPSVPEPSATLLFLAGIGALAAARRRKLARPS